MMRKVFAIAGLAALICGATNIATAQNNHDYAENDHELVLVTAYVLVPLQIHRLSDLDFGKLRRDVAKTINASDAGAALLMVSGDAEEDIQFMYPAPPATVTLYNTDDNEAETMQATLHAKTSTTQGGFLVGYTSGTGVELTGDGGGNGTMDGSGQRYFRIGGTVHPSNDQARGTYNGSFEVSADYYP